MAPEQLSKPRDFDRHAHRVVAESTSHLGLCARPADPDPARPEEKTDSGGGCFVHLADIVPTRSHMKGPSNQAWDLDALRTMEVKADYLGRAIRGWMVNVVRA